MVSLGLKNTDTPWRKEFSQNNDKYIYIYKWKKGEHHNIKFVLEGDIFAMTMTSAERKTKQATEGTLFCTLVLGPGHWVVASAKPSEGEGRRKTELKAELGPSFQGSHRDKLGLVGGRTKCVSQLCLNF